MTLIFQKVAREKPPADICIRLGAFAFWAERNRCRPIFINVS
jgi:hypothetical protein